MRFYEFFRTVIICNTWSDFSILTHRRREFWLMNFPQSNLLDLLIFGFAKVTCCTLVVVSVGFSYKMNQINTRVLLAYWIYANYSPMRNCKEVGEMVGRGVVQFLFRKNFTTSFILLRLTFIRDWPKKDQSLFMALDNFTNPPILLGPILYWDQPTIRGE